jgi:hypothetical protein
LEFTVASLGILSHKIPIRVSIGPVTKEPSWAWCGDDLIEEMSSSVTINTFDDYDSCTRQDPDILMIVKKPPKPDKWKELGCRKKIIYLPVDYFRTESHIAEHSLFLKDCSLIATHCTRLDKYLKNYCTSLARVEHYAKYALPTMNEFKQEGFVLWIGIDEYVPLVQSWYRRRTRPFTLKILTAHPQVSETENMHVLQWTPPAQQTMLKLAKAGIDIKGNDFHQSMKPPTKVQQFAASGVPVAVNKDSYPWEYFHKDGLDLAGPDDTDRWFSHEYWKEIHDFGLNLREKISKTNVARSYLDLIERVL